MRAVPAASRSGHCRSSPVASPWAQVPWPQRFGRHLYTPHATTGRRLQHCCCCCCCCTTSMGVAAHHSSNHPATNALIYATGRHAGRQAGTAEAPTCALKTVLRHPMSASTRWSAPAWSRRCREWVSQGWPQSRYEVPSDRWRQNAQCSVWKMGRCWCATASSLAAPLPRPLGETTTSGGGSATRHQSVHQHQMTGGVASRLGGEG
jgi:hypothetical protein